MSRNNQPPRLVEVMTEQLSHENQALIDITLQAAKPVELGLGKIYLARNGDETALFDLTTDQYRERQGLGPIRKRGGFCFTELEGFCSYINAHKLEKATTLWADRDKGVVKAIINGHGQGASDVQADWGDHQAVLTLKQTKEWGEWVKISGELQDQAEFADFLEDHQADIREPHAAQLLEIATSIQASTGTTFSQAIRPSSGEVQFQFVENIEGKAGRTGQLRIPTQIKLGITPWEGLAPFAISARFRFRLGGSGGLKLGVTLDRPADVLKAAFGEVLEKIGTDTSLEVFHGTPA